MIDAVVDTAVDASMEAEEVEDANPDEDGDESLLDAREPRFVSSDVPAAKPPPRERRTPSPPAARRRDASGEAKRRGGKVFADADVGSANEDANEKERLRRLRLTRRERNASTPLTLEALFAHTGAFRPEDVTSVDITGGAYDSIDLAALRAVAPFVERLLAAENALRSADVAALGAVARVVRRVDVACNRVDDTFRVVHAAGGPCFASLTVLDARGNAIGPRAFAELGKLPSLERLDVSSNAVGFFPDWKAASACTTSETSAPKPMTETETRNGEATRGSRVPQKPSSSREGTRNAAGRFFPRLARLDVSAQTPKLRFTMSDLAACLGSCPRLRVLAARANAATSEPRSDAALALTPSVDFPSLRALDLRDNALSDVASVAPLCALAVKGERRARRSFSGVLSDDAEEDDAEEDEALSFSAFKASRGFAADASSSFPSFPSFPSFGGGRLEEVALSGNACAAALSRMRLAETAGLSSSSVFENAAERVSEFSLRRRSNVVSSRALASRSALFRGVEPPTRFGGASALAAPMRAVRAWARRRRLAAGAGEDFYHRRDDSEDFFPPERGALFTLADGGADGETPRPRERFEMRRMATASDASPAHATATKLAFDFERRVDARFKSRHFKSFVSEDEDVGETTDAAVAAAAMLDASLETERRKDFNRKYAESMGIAGETRARARATARARSERTLGRVVDEGAR